MSIKQTRGGRDRRRERGRGRREERRKRREKEGGRERHLNLDESLKIFYFISQ
jgi:hypothetical protein